jgi:acyl-CoA reductase-like NAD-dependent aldehyde dehydrogenase
MSSSSSSTPVFTALSSSMTSIEPHDTPPPPKTGDWLYPVNPATGQPLQPLPCDSPEQVADKLAAARQASTQWQAVPIKQRAQIINALAQALLDEAEPLCRLMCEEMGKPVIEALQTDILTAVGSLRYLAKQAPKVLAPQSVAPLKVRLLGRAFKVHRIAHGVVAVISPWNYPIGTPATALGSALLAGNTVVFKPSELTPRCGQRLAELVQDVLVRHGLPAAICQVVTGGRDTARALIDSGKVDFAFFTGSEPAGRAIQRAMAAQGKGCSLELGGSDAMVVLPSATSAGGEYLPDVVRYALWGRFTNAGQTCAAVKRLIVHRSVYPAVLAQVKQAVEALRVGNPTEPETQIGPMASAAQKALIADQLADAVAHGATVWQAPLPDYLPPQGAYFPLTIVTDAPPNSRVWQEEVFGPVLAVWPYDEVADLRAHTVENRFGLGLSLFGVTAQAMAVLAELGPNTAGHVAINDLPTTHYAFAELPWSGLKASGAGVRNSAEGLLEMTRRQVVGGQTQPNPAPWLFKVKGKVASWAATRAMVAFMTEGRITWPLWRYFG